MLLLKLTIIQIINIALVTTTSNNQLFKRLMLSGYDWTQFVYKTSAFNVDTKIECGGYCNYQPAGCDLFVHEPSLNICHVGIFENGNKNYLSSVGVGETPVYINIGNCRSFD